MAGTDTFATNVYSFSASHSIKPSMVGLLSRHIASVLAGPLPDGYELPAGGSTSVTLMFQRALDAGEHDQMAAAVASFDPVAAAAAPPDRSTLALVPHVFPSKQINANPECFQTTLSCSAVQDVAAVVVVSSHTPTDDAMMMGMLGSYDVRVVNMSAKQVIGSCTLSNVAFETDWIDVAPRPSTNDMLELQVRTGTCCHHVQISSLSFGQAAA